MANISFFGRLGNLWKGFLSLWITDVEKAHPDIAYQNAIDSMIEKYNALKAATASIIRRRQDIQARLQNESAELNRVSADLEAALSTSQDDLAIILIQKKNELTASVAVLTADSEQSEADANDAKDSLIQVKSEIEKLKAEKDRMLAQMASAQARVKIQDQLEGLSVDAEVKALDNVREHIKNTVAAANLGKELNDSDLDVRLKKIRQSSGAITAKQELEQMKLARAAKVTESSKQM